MLSLSPKKGGYVCTSLSIYITQPHAKYPALSPLSL